VDEFAPEDPEDANLPSLAVIRSWH
jgi:hypothetical protein